MVKIVSQPPKNTCRVNAEIGPDQIGQAAVQSQGQGPLSDQQLRHLSAMGETGEVAGNFAQARKATAGEVAPGRAGVLDLLGGMARKERIASTAADDARALHRAMAGLGTDEDKILETLRGKSPQQFQAIADAYRAQTADPETGRAGESLRLELEGDLDAGELSELEQALPSGFPVPTPFDDARKIHKAFNRIPIDTRTMTNVLRGKDDEQFAAVCEEYRAFSSLGLEMSLKVNLKQRTLSFMDLVMERSEKLARDSD
jgi:hypothetical protein